MVVWPKPGNTRSHPAALNLAFLEVPAGGRDLESHQSQAEEQEVGEDAWIRAPGKAESR